MLIFGKSYIRIHDVKSIINDIAIVMLVSFSIIYINESLLKETVLQVILEKILILKNFWLYMNSYPILAKNITNTMKINFHNSTKTRN